MEKRYSRMAGVLVMGFAIFFAAKAFAAEVKPIEFNHASISSPGSITGRVDMEWLNSISKSTDGRVKGTFFPGGALGKGPETLKLIRSGTIGSGGVARGFTRDFPVLEFLEIPYRVANVSAGVSIAYEIFKSGYLDKDLKGTKLMFMYTTEHTHLFTTKKKIVTMDDFKGMKIRAAGAGVAAMIKAWGGIPVTIPPPEIYMALEKGTVDGLIGGWGLIEGTKLYELTKYVLWEPLGIGALMNVMNIDLWNRIPGDLQAKIQEVNTKMVKWSTDKMDELNQTGQDFLKKRGIEINRLSDAERARWDKTVSDTLMPVVKQSWKAEGLNADEVMKECLSLAEKYK
jgi:TRAP-type C4-dicarboxylate transport system substrate-binding protein